MNHFNEETVLDHVTPMQTWGEIAIYSICDVEDFGEQHGVELLPYGNFDLVKERLKLWRASFYAAPRGDFFLFKAVRLAKEEGNTRVIVEDMS